MLALGGKNDLKSSCSEFVAPLQNIYLFGGSRGTSGGFLASSESSNNRDGSHQKLYIT